LKYSVKVLLWLTVTFTLLLCVLYFVISYDKKNQIDAALSEQLEHLDISYQQGLDRFSVIAHTAYISIQNDTKLLEILEKASKKEDVDGKLYGELYDYYKAEYEKLTFLDVMYVQFILPNSTSFVRMHKAEKFGDDLRGVRYSVELVNKEKNHVSGFEEGKTSHAYRHVYPLYHDGKYIGCVDIAFSSTILQNYTMRANNIHTHFIVNKKVFKTTEWQRNVIEPYENSIEHEDYMFSLSDHVNHSVLLESGVKIITPLRELVNEKIATKKQFAIYKEVEDKVRIVAFLPINNIRGDQAVAYLVSYTDSNTIKTILNNFKIVMSVITFLLVLVMVAIYQGILYRKTLKHELQYDGLTKIFNRKHFFKLAEEEIEKSQKYRRHVSIVMVDIDFFKRVNDTHGHQVGDEVLYSVAHILNTSLREADMVARYGGEEFVILMLTDERNAHVVMEKIRLRIENHSFADELELKMTISCGISQFIRDETLEDCIKRADKALYKSKNDGRNRITSM